jgi:hypothetical protein
MARGEHETHRGDAEINAEKTEETKARTENAEGAEATEKNQVASARAVVGITGPKV